MKKTILSICIMLVLTSCQKEDIKDNTISKITERTMYEKMINQNITNLEDKPQEEISIEEPKENIETETSTTEIETKEEAIIEEEVINPSEVDKSTSEYQIHKGIIDCLTIDECMNISVPIQFELKYSIDNVTYLEVKNRLHSVLGYFIAYNFNNYQYEGYDECQTKKAYLDETLIDRISNSKCLEDGTLLINYGGEQVD